MRRKAPDRGREDCCTMVSKKSDDYCADIEPIKNKYKGRIIYYRHSSLVGEADG